MTNENVVPSPGLLIYPDRIRRNLQRMVQWSGDASRIRPHVKTHKLPQIIQMKLEAGITKFKTSTIAESEMTASAGGKDVLLAYQPVGPNIQRLIKLQQAFPETCFSTIVDNEPIAQELSGAAEAVGLVIRTYLDLNVGMDRTGIPPGPEAATVYRSICQLPGLHASGFHAYDGHLHDTDADRLLQQAEQAFAPVWQLRDQLRGEDFSVPQIVGCGTPTSQLMLARHEDIEVSAGTSVLWDAGQPSLGPESDMEQAAVLICRVISRPTGDRLCIDLGHKAVASEFPLPRVKFFGLEEAQQVMHSEEHLVLQTPRAADFPPGTVLYGVPYHICPTVALHSHAWPVSDGRAGAPWPVVARNRSLTV
ncbi:D-TA family PLP-dependent enzyme [Roseiconus nitratireducens]|uniref:D-TA family PLP-dependent enzyme n=1 Tax=Roseiconus nitratireducens TaxID=2605748 RepID=A0A5M6DBG1_9BACT|nr:D-TA family PLP-dependent enzyme [Roseiconus nitratireducens]